MLSFEAQQDSVLHGFSGFFNAVLYKDVTLSTIPGTCFEGTLNGLSLFFPFRVSIFKVEYL
jgi:protein arginine N-methyltransferase 5